MAGGLQGASADCRQGQLPDGLDCAFCEKLDPGAFVVGGHSYGGPAALLAAASQRREQDPLFKVRPLMASQNYASLVMKCKERNQQSFAVVFCWDGWAPQLISSALGLTSRVLVCMTSGCKIHRVDHVRVLRGRSARLPRGGDRGYCCMTLPSARLMRRRCRTAWRSR